MSLVISNKIVRLSFFIAGILVFILLVYGYLFFEAFITEQEVEIKIINKEKFGRVEGKYFVFTEDEVFVNSNEYYHNKSNADKLDKRLFIGKKYRVRVVGTYIPFLHKFRNILDIISEKKTESNPNY
jgi:hypothetical protein